MSPAIGRIVIYTQPGGEDCPAIVVGVTIGTTVSLRLFRNDRPDEYRDWVQNVNQGEGPYTWRWPERQT